MILAFDSNGQSYVALSQNNTTSEVFSLFMRDLVKQLNTEERRWRQNVLMVTDGARYHRSRETLEMLQELDVPIMLNGPHSYDAAPCEGWFALFKRVNINPRKLPTGKT
jgi:hypothetical protein